MFDDCLSYESALAQNPNLDAWRGIPVRILDKLVAIGWNPLAVAKTIWDDNGPRYYVDILIEHNETLELDSVVILDFEEQFDQLDVIQRIEKAVDQFIDDRNNPEPF